MAHPTQPRALICWNLRKEWVADQREIAGALERQAWCLDQARQSGWSVFHAQEPRAPVGVRVGRGALSGLAPRRHEPVFLWVGGSLGEGALGDAMRSAGATCVHVVGFGRVSALSEAFGALDAVLIEDAFVDLGGSNASQMRRLSSLEAFSTGGAEIVNLGDWRRSGRKWARERIDGSAFD